MTAARTIAYSTFASAFSGCLYILSRLPGETRNLKVIFFDTWAMFILFGALTVFYVLIGILGMLFQFKGIDRRPLMNCTIFCCILAAFSLVAIAVGEQIK